MLRNGARTGLQEADSSGQPSLYTGCSSALLAVVLVVVLLLLLVLVLLLAGAHSVMTADRDAVCACICESMPVAERVRVGVAVRSWHH